MWLKSSCVSCQWRTLHLLAPLVSSPSTLLALCQHFGNACAFKSFKGSRREPLPVSQSTFPSHYPGSVLLCVIETVVTVKAVWVNSQEKNDMKLQHLVAFSEVNVCLTSKSLIRGSVCWGFFFGGCYCNYFLWGKRFGRFPWKKNF